MLCMLVRCFLKGKERRVIRSQLIAGNTANFSKQNRLRAKVSQHVPNTAHTGVLRTLTGRGAGKEEERNGKFYVCETVGDNNCLACCKAIGSILVKGMFSACIIANRS